MRIVITLEFPDNAKISVAAPEPIAIAAAGRQIFADQLEPLHEEPPLPTQSPFAGSMQVHGFAPGGGNPPAAAMSNGWAVGQIHQQGHSPLKNNRRGIYCPTPMGKDANGETVFCQWKP